jgi:hypothetical protein
MAMLGEEGNIEIDTTRVPHIAVWILQARRACGGCM